MCSHTHELGKNNIHPCSFLCSIHFLENSMDVCHYVSNFNSSYNKLSDNKIYLKNGKFIALLHVILLIKSSAISSITHYQPFCMNLNYATPINFTSYE